MTTTSIQSMETVKNQFFQDHHYQPKVETVKNQLFQYHHILQIWKLLKCLLPRPPHPPKVETVKNQLFQDHHNDPK